MAMTDALNRRDFIRSGAAVGLAVQRNPFLDRYEAPPGSRD